MSQELNCFLYSEFILFIGIWILGLFTRKGLTFEKLKLSNSKITSDKFTTITLNLKNREEKFDNILVTTKTDDLNNQYLKIDKSSLQLPSLDFPNRNTGDHEITITPYNIPLNKMTFKITLDVFANNNPKSVLRKEFNLNVMKKSWKQTFWDKSLMTLLESWRCFYQYNTIVLLFDRLVTDKRQLGSMWYGIWRIFDKLKHKIQIMRGVL